MIAVALAGLAYIDLSPDRGNNLSDILVVAVVALATLAPMIPRPRPLESALAMSSLAPEEMERTCFDPDAQLGTDDIDPLDMPEAGPEQSGLALLLASAAMELAEAAPL